MQPSKHITIHLVDRMGVIFDQRSMANTTRVVDLEVLRRCGAYKIEVPSTTRNKKSNNCIKWTHANAQKNKLKSLKTLGGAQ